MQANTTDERWFCGYTHLERSHNATSVCIKVVVQVHLCVCDFGLVFDDALTDPTTTQHSPRESDTRAVELVRTKFDLSTIRSFENIWMRVYSRINHRRSCVISFRFTRDNIISRFFESNTSGIDLEETLSIPIYLSI